MRATVGGIQTLAKAKCRKGQQWSDGRGVSAVFPNVGGEVPAELLLDAVVPVDVRPLHGDEGEREVRLLHAHHAALRQLHRAPAVEANPRSGPGSFWYLDFDDG
eukprot:EG_transcript_46379